MCAILTNPEFAGALYHVTSRGDGREDIYLDDEDRRIYLEVLRDVCERFNWVVLKMVANMLGTQVNTAATLVNDFAKYGVLHELTGKRRNRIFWFKDYIVIFRRQDEQE